MLSVYFSFIMIIMHKRPSTCISGATFIHSYIHTYIIWGTLSNHSETPPWKSHLGRKVWVTYNFFFWRYPLLYIQTNCQLSQCFPILFMTSFKSKSLLWKQRVSNIVVMWFSVQVKFMFPSSPPASPSHCTTVLYSALSRGSVLV